MQTFSVEFHVYFQVTEILLGGLVALHAPGHGREGLLRAPVPGYCPADSRPKVGSGGPRKGQRLSRIAAAADCSVMASVVWLHFPVHAPLPLSSSALPACSPLLSPLPPPLPSPVTSPLPPTVPCKLCFQTPRLPRPTSFPSASSFVSSPVLPSTPSSVLWVPGSCQVSSQVKVFI